MKENVRMRQNKTSRNIGEKKMPVHPHVIPYVRIMGALWNPFGS